MADYNRTDGNNVPNTTDRDVENYEDENDQTTKENKRQLKQLTRGRIPSCDTDPRRRRGNLACWMPDKTAQAVRIRRRRDQPGQSDRWRYDQPLRVFSGLSDSAMIISAFLAISSLQRSLSRRLASTRMPPESNQVAPAEPEPKKKWVFVDLVDGCDTVVVLFGWAGCQQRYLAKYAQFYKEAGLSTICYTAPIAKIRAFSSYTRISNYFWRETEKLPLPEKIFFHVFSMNGCSLFTALWDTLPTRPGGDIFKARVRGVLFDSSPAHTSPSQSANAVSFATFPPAQYNAALRIGYRAALYTFFSVQRGIMYMRSFVDQDVYEKTFAYFRLFNITDLPDNQLYLYGPGDEVCSAESIEYFAQEMSRRQKNVDLKSMDDSLHCAHYRTHPELYRDACLHFIDSHRSSSDCQIEVKIPVPELKTVLVE